MFTYQLAPVLVLSAALLVNAQYGGSGSGTSTASAGGSAGYRKGGSSQKHQSSSSSQNGIPSLEMMISQMMSQPSRSSTKGDYGSGGSISSGGGGGYNGGKSSMMTKPMSKPMAMPMPMPKSIMNSMMMSSYGSQDSKLSYPSSGYEMPSSMPVRAAVMSTHSVEHRDVPSEMANIQPQTILVEAMNIPLNILFQSKSSSLNLQSEHVPSPGSTQETNSEDEPQILKHTVTRPIEQTVLELIIPKRYITQEIKPVEETVKTLVARAVPSENKYEAVQSSKYGSGSSGGNGGDGGSMSISAAKYGSSSSTKSSSGMEYQQEHSKGMPNNEQMLSQMINVLKMEIPKQYLQMGGYSYSPPATSSKSRMQMYMSQMGEPMNGMNRRQQQQRLEEEEQHQATYDQESEGGSGVADGNNNDLRMMIPTGSSKVESLPLELAAEPELKEDDAQHQHQSTTEEGVLLGDEQKVTAAEVNAAVSSAESSTPNSLTSEKSTGSSLPTIMIYSSAPIQQQQQQQQKKKKAEKNRQKSTTTAVPNGAAKIGLVQKSFLQSSNVEPSGY